MVLVMNATGSLVPPPVEGDDPRDDHQKRLWAATHERIDRFLPGFLVDVLPPLLPVPPNTAVPSEEPQQS